MAQEGTPYLLPFGRQGMLRHENRWLATAEQLRQAENVSFENDLAQKEQSVQFYDDAGAAPDNLQAVWSFAVRWGANVVAYRATATTPAVPVGLLSGVASTTSPWTATALAQVWAAGLMAIASVQVRSGAAVTSVSDSKGNTWVRTSVSIPGPGPNVEQWASILTTALQIGDTFTVAFSGAATSVILIVSGWQNMPSTITTVRTGIDQQLSTNVAVSLSYLTGFPILLIGSLGAVSDTSVATHTWQNGYFGGGLDLNVAVQGQLHQSRKYRSSSPALIAQHEWHSDATSAASGTASVVSGSAFVTGVAGTLFDLEFHYGDQIQIGGETQIVLSVVSGTSLETISPWVTTQTAQPITRIAGPVIITATLAGQYTNNLGALVKETPINEQFGTLRGVVLKANLVNSLRRGVFVIGGKESALRARKLFYFNGSDPIAVLAGDGVTMTNIANPSPDWGTVQDALKQPVNGIVHQDSLMAFGNLNDAHRLYVSNPADHEDFTSGGGAITLRIASQIGQRLWCAAEYQGVLYLWKYPEGIFYVDDTSTDRFAWGYRIRSRALGCAPSPHAVLSVEDDVLFCDPNGHFHLLSAVNTLGGTRASDITRTLGLQQWTQEMIDIASLGQLSSTYSRETKIAYFGCRSVNAASDDNDLLLKFDFALVDRDGPIRFSYDTCFKPNSIILKRDVHFQMPRLFIGEESTSYLALWPTVYGSRTEAYDGAGPLRTGYALTLATAECDLSDEDPKNRNRRKAFRAIELVAKDSAFQNQLHSTLTQQPVTVSILVDGVLGQTLTFDGQPTPTRQERRLFRSLQCGDGYEIQIIIAQASVNCQLAGDTPADLPLLGVILWWIPLGQEHTKRS